MPKTPIVQELEYEKSFIDKEDYTGRIVGVIDRVYEEEKELKPLFANSHYRVKNRFGEESNIYRKFDQIFNDDIEFIYIIGIFYKTQKEQYEKLEKAYEIFEHLNVDVISTTTFNLGDYYYSNPNLLEKDKADIRFKLQAIFKDRVIDEKLFQTQLETNGETSRIGDKVAKNYFEDFYHLKETSFNLNTNRGFEYYMEDLNNIHIFDNKITVRDPSGDTYQNGHYTTRKIYAKNFVQNDGKIKDFELIINGDFVEFGKRKGVSVYYITDKMINYERCSLDKNISTYNSKYVKFKIELNNKDEIKDAPEIWNININLNINHKPDLKYNIVGSSKYVIISSSSDGSSYIEGRINVKDFIQDNRDKIYFIKQLAQHCHMNDAIGIVSASLQKEDETKNQWYSRLLKEIDSTKTLLSNDNLVRRIGVIVNEGQYFDEVKDEIFIDSSLLGILSLLVTLESSSNPTNKELVSLSDINNVFSKKEIKNLSRSGYTVSYKSSRNGITTYKFASLEDKDELFSNLNPMRIVNEIKKRLKYILDDFIGISNRNMEIKIDKAIRRELENIEREGKILDFSYYFVELTDNSIRVNLEIYLEGSIESTPIEVGSLI